MSGVNSIQFFLDFWNFLNFAKPPKCEILAFLSPVLLAIFIEFSIFFVCSTAADEDGK